MLERVLDSIPGIPKMDGQQHIAKYNYQNISYIFPEKVIVVVYITGMKANISVRGKKIRSIVLEAIKEIEGATGGGHENAVGCRMKIEDLGRFRESIEKLSYKV